MCKNLNASNTYINSCKMLWKIQKEIQKLTDKLSFLNNAVVTQIQLAPSNEEQIQSLFQYRINDLQVTLQEKVSTNLNTFYFISINWNTAGLNWKASQDKINLFNDLLSYSLEKQWNWF